MARKLKKHPKSKLITEPSAAAASPPIASQPIFKPKTALWPFALLLLVLFAPFASILLSPGDQVLGAPKADNALAYYYYNYFAGQSWRQGSIPLWNPHLMLGIPFLGEGQASLFHPLSMLFAFLRTSVATNWLIALSCMLTGVLFYGYLRALGLSRAASWCGAVTWSFSNAMISRLYAGHLNILLSFISMPLIMMCWERYRADRRRRNLVGISFGYGLMLLAYYPQLVYIFTLFLLLYALIQSGLTVAESSVLVRSEGQALLMLGLSLGLGVALGTVQLLPGLDFVSQSFRQQSTLAFAGSYSLPPENILTLIAPGFFGDVPTSQTETVPYWGRNYNLWEMWIYLGVLPLLMAVAGAWTAPRRQRLTLLVCAVLFLLIGLGKYTPLFPVLYEYLPLFDLFRGPSKYTLITLYCLVTLSAYGFEGLFTEDAEAKRRQLLRVIAVAGGVLLLTAISIMAFLVLKAEGPGSNWQGFMTWIQQSGYSSFSANGPLTPDQISATAHRAGLALGRGMVLIVLSCAMLFLLRSTRWRHYRFPLAAALILADLLNFYRPMVVTFDRTSTIYPLEIDGSATKFSYRPRIAFPGSPTPNIAMKSGYSSPFGYTGNTLKRYNDLISRIQGLDINKSHAFSVFRQHTPEHKLLALDAIALPPDELPPGAQPIGSLGDRVLVSYEHFNDSLPRVFLAAEPRYFSQSEEALSYVFAPQTDLLTSPAIERQGETIAPHPLESGETADFLSYEPNRIVLEARSNRPRELVLSSMFEKNWTATVNGSPAEISPANYAYRAVQVPAGTSQVVFEYRPMAFYWGAVISAAALVLLVLVWIRDGHPSPKLAKTYAPDPLPHHDAPWTSPFPARLIQHRWPSWATPHHG